MDALLFEATMSDPNDYTEDPSHDFFDHMYDNEDAEEWDECEACGAPFHNVSGFDVLCPPCREAEISIGWDDLP